MKTQLRDAKTPSCKKGWYAAMALLLGAVGSAASAQVVHLVEPGGMSAKSVSPAQMDGRIRSAAEQYRQYAPVPRIALYDWAYPKDSAEYEAMNGYAVLLITALTQDSSELPLRRVYVRTSRDELDLNSVTWLRSDERAMDPLSAHVFGRHRVDALYLLPVALAVGGGQLLTDFQVNRDGFALARLAGQLPPALAEHVRVRLPTADRPSTAAIARLLSREYPGFVRP
jgi:hypothetical protein